MGIRVFGGGWSAFAAAREAKQAQAEAERDRADAALRATHLAAQAAWEARNRRDKAGRAFAAKRSEPKIMLGQQAERAENSGDNARRLAERQLDDTAHASQTARARIEILTPLTSTSACDRDAVSGGSAGDGGYNG